MEKSVAEIYTDAMRVVAERHAKTLGFDIENEPHGWARMLTLVMGNRELRQQACNIVSSDMEGKAKDELY